MMGSAIFRCSVTEAQANTLRERIDKMGLNVGYQEEQHGPRLVVLIDCTPSQEKLVREMLHEVGADGDQTDEEHERAELQRMEAEIVLDQLTGGWFGRELARRRATE